MPISCPIITLNSAMLRIAPTTVWAKFLPLHPTIVAQTPANKMTCANNSSGQIFATLPHHHRTKPANKCSANKSYQIREINRQLSDVLSAVLHQTPIRTPFRRDAIHGVRDPCICPFYDVQ